MGALTAKLTLTGTAADYGSALNLSNSKSLTVEKPWIGISKETVTTTGESHIIIPNIDARRFVYIKHTGVDSTGSAVTSDLQVENYTNNTSGVQQVMVLKAGEFAFFPFDNGVADPTGSDHDNKLQLQASAGDIIADYSYYTVSST
tara:strand:- start:171 stop:608 length:438 start_codon:yes stop_codon:yes gene_type:complete